MRNPADGGGAALLLPAELKVCARRSWGREGRLLPRGVSRGPSALRCRGNRRSGGGRRALTTAGFAGAQGWEGGAAAPRNRTPGWEAGG